MKRCLAFLCFAVVTRAFSLPPTLSSTGLYDSIAAKQVSSKVRSFTPQYPLWSDGLVKQRWVLIPSGKKIEVSDSTDPWRGTPDHWLFPVGTKFWKEFSLRQGSSLRRIETRFIEKVGEEEWEMGTYLWNETETEATLAPEDGVKDYIRTSPTTQHDIPSVAQCLQCHRRGGDTALGFDALQLSTDRDASALHAEPLKPADLSLRELIEKNFFSTIPPEFHAGATKVHASNSLTRTVLGYLHSNCASCHNTYGSSMHVRMDLKHSVFAQDEASEAAIANTFGKRTTVFSFPGEPKTFRAVKGKPELSALSRLMKTHGPSHMPLIGANIVDNEAILLIEKWIKEAK